jgi:ribulose-5-phosphate 4-epimerase/fuculose-1-phosphate aldolase
MTRDEAKLKLVAGGHILAAEGHGDLTRGHISVRDPEDASRFYMKPHSFGFDEMTTDNLVTCDLDGEKVDGWAPRHSEVYIHSEILKMRPDLTSVIHTHPTYSVAFSATGRPMRALSQPSALFVNNYGVYTGTIDLIRSQDMGRGVAQALENFLVVFLKNHGVVVCGASIEEAVIVALMLENACQIQMIAEAAGETAPEFPSQDVMALRKKLVSPEQNVVNFNYLRRKVERTK